jgi:hypothetical protein
MERLEKIAAWAIAFAIALAITYWLAFYVTKCGPGPNVEPPPAETREEATA